MKFKLDERASISDAFKTAVLKLYEEYLKERRARYDALHAGYAKQAFLKDNGTAIAKVQKYLKDPAAFDYQLTRLRSLPYTNFKVVRQPDWNNCGVTYLVGTTKDIIMIDAMDYKWKLGQYDVYIPLPSFKRGSIEEMHFIPLREPLCQNRHPHHYGSAKDIDEDDIEYPTQRSPQTCWGNFGQIVTACTRSLDVAELFRSLAFYVERYNWDSPLVNGGLRSISFKERV
jgi:hypothetical protein